MAISSERIEFTGSGGEALAARLDRPLGPPAAHALFAHCFTCSKDVFAAARISTALAERGIAVLRFDFTGLGSSGGDFANTNFSSNVDDLVLAADYLAAEHAPVKILIGHSLGGAAVLAAAERIPAAAAVATLNAPSDPEHVRHLLAAAVPAIEAEGEAEVTIAGRCFRIRRQFLEDIAAQPMQARIGALRKALLVMHAPQDEVVGLENAGAIFEAAKHPKSFVALDGADHLLSRHADAEYVAAVLAAWASRYLGDGAGTAPALRAAPGEVLVAETGEGRYANAIAVGSHVLHADEPVKNGGDDTGPDPYGLLMASLGS